MLFVVHEPNIVADILRGVAKLVPEGTFVWIGPSADFNREQLRSVSQQLRESIIAEASYNIFHPFLQYFRNLTLVSQLL